MKSKRHTRVAICRDGEPTYESLMESDKSDLNSLWLAGGYPLTLVQRVGMILLSLLFVLVGLVFVVTAGLSSGYEWYGSVPQGVVGCVLLFLGTRGIVMAIRAKCSVR